LTSLYNGTILLYHALLARVCEYRNQYTSIAADPESQLRYKHEQLKHFIV
jgi:hypothetical protein